MKIISLNAWGGQVWPALGGWAQTVGADVLSCQEMIAPAETSPEWLAYRDAYRSLNQRADLFGDISKRLPEHTGDFIAAAEGPLKDMSGKVFRSRHGLGQWVSNRYVIVKRQHGFVCGSFRAQGWGAEPVPRAFQAVRIACPADVNGGRDLTVAHFHGLRDANGKQDTPERAEQARRAITLLSQIAKPDDAVVLSGDFNVRPDSETLSIFSAWGLRDLVGTADTRTQLYAKPVRHANYMLVSKSVQVKSFAAPADPVVSDHRPLILDL